MWFVWGAVGAVAGCVLGVWLDKGGELIFLLSLAGMVGLPFQMRRASATPAANAEIEFLQRQMKVLEERVQHLERSRPQHSAPVSAPVIEVPRPAAPAVAVVPAPPPKPSVESTPLPKPISVPAAQAVEHREMVTAAAPAPATPRPAPAPTPRPVASPLTLRQRLPAPLASLIFDGNVLVKVGVLILFIGLSFLLRFAAEHISVPVGLRYTGVAMVGVVLLALGWRLRGKRRDYALVLQGAGIGVFDLTILAAMKWHELLPPEIGFAALLAVVLLSAVLAVAQDAPLLAIVAALEGFAAPVLASTGQNRPIGLFTYLLVLDVGIAVVAWFKAWRVLNLIALTGSFTLAAAWAQRYYTDEQYGTVQPYLIAFFLLFTAVGVMFARRSLLDTRGDTEQTLAARAVQALQRVGRVDSTLVFGVPMVAFALQYRLMQLFGQGAALSAMAMAAFYLLLARGVFAYHARGLALLAEAYAIVGVIFGTLAVPLGLEGKWTGVSWAVEAAGMYWLGARQQRPYARAFAFAVLGGAAIKLLQATHFSDAIGVPLFQGTVIGPLLFAASALVMWAVHRRQAASTLDGWEAALGSLLPWLGVAALTLLVWQTLVPPWAAVGTAGLALVCFALAQRDGLAALGPVSGGLHALAVASFLVGIREADPSLGGGALGSGATGALAAGLIAASVLGRALWSMRATLRQARHEGQELPQWTPASIVAVLTGIGLLHLATLFELSLAQAALVWAVSSLLLLRTALWLRHGPLVGLSGMLAGVAALMCLYVHLMITPDAMQPLTPFAHLHFITEVVLGLCALLAGAAVQNAAARIRGAWFVQPLMQWLLLPWGLAWWLGGMTEEILRVLPLQGLERYSLAALLALLLATSLLMALAARWRTWPILGRCALATLPLLIWLVLRFGLPADARGMFVPSADLGWLLWPLALAWHLRLLALQEHWVAPARLAGLHVAGFWFFLLLAARECQCRMAGLGGENSSWQALGWVLAPALALWGVRARALQLRWPLRAFTRAYQLIASAPVALYLLIWVCVSNVQGSGDATPLPYVPVLNPLELAQILVLLVLVVWQREWMGANKLAAPVLGVVGLGLLTGIVLRSCHHWAGLPWEAGELFHSFLAQAALSIVWALTGVAVMVLGNRRHWRAAWMVGAVLLGVVVLKLFFVDFADRGGLFRIVSFMTVGALLLLVGWFAPVPPTQGAAGPRREEVA